MNGEWDENTVHLERGCSGGGNTGVSGGNTRDLTGMPAGVDIRDHRWWSLLLSRLPWLQKQTARGGCNFRCSYCLSVALYKDIYIYIYIYILHCYASHYSTYCPGARSIYFYQMETSTIWYCFYAGICQVVCMFVYLIQLPSGIHQLTLSVNCTCAPVDCIVHFVWYSLCNALKVCNARSFGMIKAVREQKLLMIWWKCSSCWTQIPMVANIIPIIDIRWFRKQSCDWEYAAAVD